MSRNKDTHNDKHYYRAYHYASYSLSFLEYAPECPPSPWIADCTLNFTDCTNRAIYRRHFLSLRPLFPHQTQRGNAQKIFELGRKGSFLVDSFHRKT